jgi:membrane protein DedA with SNARE-associated domain
MNLDVQLWISHYGYIGVFLVLFLEMIGIPFPAETTLTICGIEWSRGILSLTPLLFSASLGNVVGSTMAYSIGYFLGRPAILRFGRYIGISEKKLNTADEKFSPYRTSIVLFAKFIAGIRVLVPYLAGINRMPFLLFSGYNAVATVVWAACFITAGRYIGEAWSHYHRVMHQYFIPAIIVTLALATMYLCIRRRHRIQDP